jgi:hypothetical protein
VNNLSVKAYAFSLAAFLSNFLICTICYGGAWTCKKGNLYNRFAFNHYYADERFNDDGDKESFAYGGDFKDFNLQKYLEYGITDDLTLITSFYYKYIKKEDNTVEQKTEGIGDIDLALKYMLLERSWGIFSTQSLIKIPEAYDKNEDLPLGNGQYDFEFRILYGRSLWPAIPGYCNAEIGYRFRAQDPADELRYLIEFGMDITRNAYGRVKLDGIESMDNADNVDGSGGNPSLTYNFDLGKLDMALGYRISSKWAVEVGYVPEIYGKNISAGTTYAIALIYQIH